MDANPIDPAVDPLSAAPGPDEETKRTAAQSADAGTDESIAERLARNPESREAPPASTQPVHSHRGGDLPESSGYDPRKEARLAQSEDKGVIGRILAKIGLG